MMLDRAPGWLRNPFGEAWLRGTGDVLDSILYRAKDGTKARFAATAPRDALQVLGGERGIPRALSDTDAVYAQKVIGAFDAWLWAGTAKGVLSVLWDAGYLGHPRVVISNNRAFSLDADRNLVIEEGGGSFTFYALGHWSAFAVFFPKPWPAAWVTAGAPPVSASDEARDVVALIQRWKSADALLAGVYIENTGELWGWPPEGTWGDGGTWGGTSVVWTP
jgi:hypothetical protein